jgi:phage tail-like protein
MGTVGHAKDHHGQHPFKVEIDGFKESSYAECSGIEWDIPIKVYRGGGDAIANKSPSGTINFQDITLKRGVINDYDMYNWANQVANVLVAAVGGDNISLKFPAYKKNLDVVQLSGDGTVARRWTIYQAFPIKFKAGEWKAGSDEVVVEEMVLAYSFATPR